LTASVWKRLKTLERLKTLKRLANARIVVGDRSAIKRAECI